MPLEELESGMLYVVFIDDINGDLVEIEYYCSSICAPEDSGAWPGGMETDYDQHCTECGDLIREGLEYA